MLKGFWKGMTWIEWGILASVLMTLVAITVPNFAKFQCRAVQSSAKNSLFRIHAAQDFYEQNNGTYADLKTLEKLGLVKLDNKWYRFRESKNSTERAFEIIAEGVPKTRAAGDKWSINQRRELVNNQNACQ